MMHLALSPAGCACVTGGHTGVLWMATKKKIVELRRDAVLNLRVPRAMKKALERAAVEDDRSLSGMAVRMLRAQLTALGYMGKE